jgi:hypothetical protein
LHAYGDITNTFVGGAAGGAFATTGLLNTGVGYQALNANTAGLDNTAVGAQSLRINTTGSWNNAVGYQGLAGNTTGGANNAVGFQAGAGNTTASYNSAFGHMTLKATSTGAANSAFGSSALGANITGYSNSAFGASAGANNVSGANNTFVGASAGPDAASSALTYAAAIGAGAVVSQSNSLVLGGVNGTASAVSVGIGTSTPNTTLQVVGNVRIGTNASFPGCLLNYNSSASWGTCSSDLRLKSNIRPFAPVLDRVARLQPVHFTWRADEFPERHLGTAVTSGLIAQEVEQVFPEMVSVDDQGFKLVNNAELPYLTLAAVKELKAENDALRAEKDAQIRVLTEQLAALAERLARLEKRR